MVEPLVNRPRNQGHRDHRAWLDAFKPSAGQQEICKAQQESSPAQQKICDPQVGQGTKYDQFAQE